MQSFLNILAETKVQNWLWLIGLTIGTLVIVVAAVVVLKKFRGWLKSDIPTSSGNKNAFNLDEINNMKNKGLISNEEYSQLREAYINSKTK